MQINFCAELVIHIPGNLGQDGVVYRLDYYPPYGHPAPNTTIASKDIRDVIKFSQALPGTKYDFWLYYSNSTHNTLTWTANFITGMYLTQTPPLTHFLLTKLASPRKNNKPKSKKITILCLLITQTIQWTMWDGSTVIYILVLFKYFFVYFVFYEHF